jgi:hypothetical protein
MMRTYGLTGRFMTQQTLVDLSDIIIMSEIPFTRHNKTPGFTASADQAAF